MLIKPKKLQAGDLVATVSPSWGGAGNSELRWRYDLGIKRLVEVFGLEVLAMPNSLKGAKFAYNNPQARAEDLMTAFKDPQIKAIFANIGGDDSIRLLPYIDFEVIRQNPKIFIGYSDITILHLFCLKSGITSFYGPAIMVDFAENVKMHDYTIEMVKRTLFSNEPIGHIDAAKAWTSEFLQWDEANINISRKMKVNTGNEVLQGEGTVQGRLIGGCIEVLEFAKGTEIWPDNHYWNEAILFFETSEEKPEPQQLKYWLRNYAAQGILQKANGIIVAKPLDEKYFDEYKTSILDVMKEYNLEDLPILYNLNFGHTEPKFILPYGAMAEINCRTGSFSILDSGVN
ncbi:S66 family peptidase [Cytobacillus purgationiresistens]|nr:S66 peptidase family protein [Cytobacillus purgationiresistens]